MGNTLLSLPRLPSPLSPTRMESALSVPSQVRHMQQWQPELFRKTVRVACLSVPRPEISLAKKYLDKFVLKVPNMPAIIEAENNEQNSNKLLRLNPDLVGDAKDLPESLRDRWPLHHHDIELSVNNWPLTSLLTAVLGEELNLASFSNIGHVVHVNLKSRHEPFKHVIGQILMLRKGAEIVVNKTSAIDNTFRNFEFEVLAGGGDLEVTTSESGCRFQMDFSKVYWNPRLSTEHERVIDLVLEEAKVAKVIVADVFAGVGPFAVPLGRRKIIDDVLANDLNPESFKWLKINVQKNGGQKRVRCFNMDGRLFVRNVVKEVIVKDKISKDNLEKKDSKDTLLEEDSRTSVSLHVIMNLPALAIDFLDVFRGLLDPTDKFGVDKVVIHVYGFTEHKNEAGSKDLIRRISHALKWDLEECSKQVRIKQYVRNVAPNNHMMRISFGMPEHVLRDEAGVPELKRPRIQCTE